MRNLFKTSFYLAAALLIGCGSDKEPKENKGEKQPELLGVATELMDTTVNPCDDFFSYANGTWLKNTKRPESKARYGSFNEVADRNNIILKEILENAQAATDAKKGSPEQMLGDFYASAMDMEKRNKQGIEPIQSELDKIASITNKEDIFPVLAHLHTMGVGAVFSSSVSIDMKNSNEFSFDISQSGMGLPSPGMYKEGSPLKEKYEEHIANTFTVAGMENAEEKAAKVMAIETQMASKAMTPVERRNLDAQYNPHTIEEAKELAPNINWEAYLSEMNISPEIAVIAQPKYMENVSSMLTNVSIDDWKTYLKWRLLSSTSTKLNQEMFDVHFAFYGKTMTGTNEPKENWEYALANAEGAIGNLLSKQYVKKYFTPETKARLNEAIDNIVASLREKIGELNWMNENTKKEAYRKLDKLSRKIGYPDEKYWIDYTGLEINRESYVRNFLNANEAAHKREFEKWGTKVDKNDWFGMNPHMVNAFYHPSFNTIMFPAGILQPPFMDVMRDDAVLYGTVGVVIGHELTHGFDDMGKQFDADGNKINWWTKEDSTAYAKRAKVFVKQYSEYEILDSVFVNGQLTLGENIADIGGLTVSFDAYQKSLKGKERKVIEGFTPEQRFFIAYGQVWKNLASEEETKRRVEMDTHSPPKFRVNGAVANIDQFYEAFNCDINSKLYIAPENRAKMW